MDRSKHAVQSRKLAWSQRQAAKVCTGDGSETSIQLLAPKVPISPASRLLCRGSTLSRCEGKQYHREAG